MLTEDDVVEAVCRHLEGTGYRIVTRCSTTQRGEDIVAVSEVSGATLRIEAKGETSNLSSSSRYGKAFNSAQCKDHVANAFYTAAAMLTALPDGGRVGIALADTALHRRYADRIRAALIALNISVFWVSADRQVVEQSAGTG